MSKMDQTAVVSPRTQSSVRIKQLKRLLNMERPLDGWERYRALTDALDEAYDQIDLSNREARFALILMGGLNAIVILGATRADLLRSLNWPERLLAAALFGIYIVAAVYFLLQAIEALRPGHFRPDLSHWNREAYDFPKGVRYFEDVVERSVENHWRAWREVEVAQLAAELAVQHHSMCMKSNARRTALRKLYAGLRIMTVLVGALGALYLYAVSR
jgi:hypothetical protein